MQLKNERTMKKQLLTLFAAITLSAAVAQQNPSPSWSITQNAAFTNTSVGIRFMDAVDQNVMWVIGYDGFAPSRNYNWFSRTINGGTTFTAGNILPDTNTYVLANLEGVDANTAWVACYTKSIQSQGTVIRTTNGGATWSNMNNGSMFTNASSFCNFVVFLTPSVGIVQGDPINGEYELWRTTNGGLTWSLTPGANIPNPLNANEYGIVNVYAKHGNSNIWWGTNTGRMYYTNDAGLTWNVSNVLPAPAANAFVLELAFTSPLNGVCYLNNNGAFEMYNTVNGGATWSQILPTPANVGINDICAVPGSNSYVSVGAGAGNQIISVSNNNGASWTDYGSTGIQYLTVDFANQTTGWSGSFSDNVVPSIGGIWKYSGTAFTGTLVPTSNFSIPSDLCLTGATATIQPSNSSTGSTPISYLWGASPAGVVFSSLTATVPVITFSANGTYTISLTATNANGTNTSIQVINVQACNAPVASFTTASNPCNNVTFTTSNTSTGAPAPIYAWSANPSSGVNFLPSANATNPNINISTPGLYTITLIATNASGTAQATQTINVADCTPVVAFSIADAACTTNSVTTTNTVTGATVNTFTWSNVPNSGVFVINAPGGNKTYIFSNAGTYTITLKASNASGTNQAVQTITVDACVGLTENITAGNSLEVFPNPAKDEFSVTLPNTKESYNVTLVNVLGAVVFETTTVKNAAEKLNINVANQPAGVYFLNVQSKSEKFTRKIVIE
jgi:photosystem II stability/assembly factor-like uncharacterized protein